MLYEFKLSHDTMEATESIFCAESKCAVDHRTGAIWLKKFYLGCKNLNNQARSGRCKTVDSEAVLSA